MCPKDKESSRISLIMLKLNLMKFFLVGIFLFLFISFSRAEDSLCEQAGVYREKGYQLQAIGDINGAITYYQKAIHLEPKYVEAYNDLGVLFEARGDLDSAVSMYKKTIEIDESYLSGYTNLALLYENIENFEASDYYWQKRYSLGEEGEYWREIAREHLIQINANPPLVEERRRLERAKQQKQAEKLLKEVGDTRSKNARFRFEAGSNLFLKEDYAGALAEFRAAKLFNPPDKEFKNQIDEFIVKVKIKQVKVKILNHIEEAKMHVNNDDFLSAGEKIKDAFSVIISHSKEKHEELPAD